MPSRQVRAVPTSSHHWAVSIRIVSQSAKDCTKYLIIFEKSKLMQEFKIIVGTRKFYELVDGLETSYCKIYLTIKFGNTHIFPCFPVLRRDTRERICAMELVHYNGLYNKK